jgi:hypothetical protein
MACRDCETERRISEMQLHKGHGRGVVLVRHRIKLQGTHLRHSDVAEGLITILGLHLLQLLLLGRNQVEHTLAQGGLQGQTNEIAWARR